MNMEQLAMFQNNHQEAPEFAIKVARKLLDEQVLFFVSAGLSISWGYKPASALARDLLQKYHDEISKFRPDKSICGALSKLFGKLKEKEYNFNLAEVCEAVVGHEGERGPCLLAGGLLGFKYKQKIQRQPWVTLEEAIEEYQQDPACLGIPHLIIARLAKEGLIHELVTTNYDTLLELGFWATGMERVDENFDPPFASPWTEYFITLPSKKDYLRSLPYRSIFRLHKIHGCADDLIKHYAKSCKHRNEECIIVDECGNLIRDSNFVITHKELLDWRSDNWAQALLEDRARNHFIVFIGFSGSDNVLHNSLRNIFREIQDCGNIQETNIRAVAIDPQDNTLLEAILRDAAGKASDPSKILCKIDGNYLTKYHPAYCTVPADAPCKLDLELVFRDIYAETIKMLLQRMVSTYGERVISEQKENGKRKKGVDPWLIIELKEELRKFIKEISLSEERNIDFLTWTLPGAVVTSWLLSRTWTKEENDFRGMERYFREHYYVPLSYNPEITIALLRIYQLFQHCSIKIDQHVYVDYFRQGWIKIVKCNGSSVAVLPLVVLKPDSVAMYQNFRRKIPDELKTMFQSSSNIMIMVFNVNGTSRLSNVPVAPLSAGVQPVPRVETVPLSSIWEETQFLCKIIKKAFEENVGGAECG